MFALRPDPEEAESLESYLIRLSEQNHFRIRKLFPHFTKLLAKDHPKLAGIMPAQLSRFNLYHAQISSNRRYQALHILSNICCKEPLPILKLAIYRSSTVYSPNYSTLLWRGTEIPHLFFRKEAFPVCPKCLKENGVISGFWHIKPIQACPVHACLMLHNCPNCGIELDYIRDEKITHCRCGYSISDASTATAPTAMTELSQLLTGINQQEKHKSNNLIFQQEDIHKVYGLILWYFSYIEQNTTHNFTSDRLTTCLNFFDHWPAQLYQRLDSIGNEAITYADKPLSETAFRSIFSSLLSKSRKLPNSRLSENPVLKAIYGFIYQLVTNENHKLKALKQLLLDSFETALLLQTPLEQLARLVEEGWLQPVQKIKTGSTIPPGQPLFKLHDVFTLWLACFQSHHSNQNIFLSRW